MFKDGPKAIQVIREALSKALVPYYLLAGQLKESYQGHAQIECSEEGVCFVEASADCSLDSVNYFTDVQSIPYDDLLPDCVPKIKNLEPFLLLLSL